MTVTLFFFYVFAAILIGSAAAVVTCRNPVHSVLCLILAFFNASALFLIAGAEFLALILVIVYVGAVAVLFLFVVMMLDVNFAQMREGFQRYAPVGGVVGLVLFAELAAVLGGWRFAPEAGTLLRASSTPLGVENTRAMGHLIYTDYIFLFQTAGLILMVAMIGAIVLTHRETSGTRRQNIGRQTGRTPETTLTMMQPVVGAGLDLSATLRPIVETAVEDTEPAHELSGSGGHH